MNVKTLVTLMLFSIMTACRAHAVGVVWFVMTDSISTWPDDPLATSNFFCLRDGTLVPYGLYIQGLRCEYDEDLLSPPTTNTTWFMPDWWYCYGNHTRPLVGHLFPTNDIVTGRDNIGQGWPEMDGTAICEVQGDDEWWAWMRVFSGVTITNSAYYGDCDPVKLAVDDYVTEWTATYYYANLVNPAYQDLTFDELPRKINATTIVGSINTVPGGANNLLANEHVTLKVSHDNGATWTNFQTLTISGPGNFTGTLAGAMLSTPQVKIIGPIDELPQSQAMTVIPEPGVLAGVVAMLLARAARTSACNQ